MHTHVIITFIIMCLQVYNKDKNYVATCAHVQFIYFLHLVVCIHIIHILTHAHTHIQNFNQLIRYQVFGHPLYLQDMELFDVPLSPTNKHIFTLVEKTITQQRIRVYTLKASNKDDKVSWLVGIYRDSNV